MVTTVTDNSPQSINTSLFSLDKEVQEIKKVTDKLAGINTESGVISVNGKQGIVELTASDVDALPSSTVIPTTTSELENTSGFITISSVDSSFVPITRKVNNKQLNTDITLTASDVGALPDTTVIPTKTSQLTNDNGFITSSDSITGNAATANKIEPNYTSVVDIPGEHATKYIKLADCYWFNAGTLQVHLRGDYFEDTLVLNFGGGNSNHPMLCGHYFGNNHRVHSVIAQKGSNWDSNYSIYVKVVQETTLTVNVALLRGDCTINIAESKIAPTNINEWTVDYGFFGNITAPNITSLEQRVAALESKI